MRRQSGQIATVLTLIAMGVMSLGALVATWAVRTPASPFYLYSKAAGGDFQFGIPDRVQVCETAPLEVEGWIKNTSGRAAEDVKLWLKPQGSGKVSGPTCPARTAAPHSCMIETMDDQETANLTLELNPVAPSGEKTVELWADAAYATSQVAKYSFVVFCPGPTPTPSPTPTVTPTPTITPTPTTTGQVCCCNPDTNCTENCTWTVSAQYCYSDGRGEVCDNSHCQVPTVTPTPTRTPTPTPTATPTLTPTPTTFCGRCGGSCCAGTQQCQSGLTCRGGLICVNPNCPNDDDCVCADSTPTPTPTVTPTPTGCPYHSDAYIKNENGELIKDATFKIGDYNFANGVVPLHLDPMSQENLPYDVSVTLKKDNVALSGSSQPWQITDSFCETTLTYQGKQYTSNTSCPQTGGAKNPIGPFTVKCGAVYSYGWVLKSTVSKPIPQPGPPGYVYGRVIDVEGNLWQNIEAARTGSNCGDKAGPIDVTNRNYWRCNPQPYFATQGFDPNQYHTITLSPPPGVDCGGVNWQIDYWEQGGGVFWPERGNGCTAGGIAILPGERTTMLFTIPKPVVPDCNCTGPGWKCVPAVMNNKGEVVSGDCWNNDYNNQEHLCFMKCPTSDGGANYGDNYVCCPPEGPTATPTATPAPGTATPTPAVQGCYCISSGCGGLHEGCRWGLKSDQYVFKCDDSYCEGCYCKSSSCVGLHEGCRWGLKSDQYVFTCEDTYCLTPTPTNTPTCRCTDYGERGVHDYRCNGSCPSSNILKPCSGSTTEGHNSCLTPIPTATPTVTATPTPTVNPDCKCDLWVGGDLVCNAACRLTLQGQKCADKGPTYCQGATVPTPTPTPATTATPTLPSGCECLGAVPELGTPGACSSACGSRKNATCYNDSDCILAPTPTSLPIPTPTPTLPSGVTPTLPPGCECVGASAEFPGACSWSCGSKKNATCYGDDDCNPATAPVTAAVVDDACQPDGEVNKADLAVMVGNYFAEGAPGTVKGDVNGDGRVDARDLSLVITFASE